MTDSEHQPQLPTGSEDPHLPVRTGSKQVKWYEQRWVHPTLIGIICFLVIIMLWNGCGKNPDKPTQDKSWHQKHDSLYNEYQVMRNYWDQRHHEDSIRTQELLQLLTQDSIPYEASNIDSIVLRVMDNDSGAEFIIRYLGQVDSVSSGFNPYQLGRVIPARTEE